jgi:hypothetical protein
MVGGVLRQDLQNVPMFNDLIGGWALHFSRGAERLPSALVDRFQRAQIALG